MAVSTINFKVYVNQVGKDMKEVRLLSIYKGDSRPYCSLQKNLYKMIQHRENDTFIVKWKGPKNKDVLQKMHGFHQRRWLSDQLLEVKQGDNGRVLRILQPMKPRGKKF